MFSGSLQNTLLKKTALNLLLLALIPSIISCVDFKAPATAAVPITSEEIEQYAILKKEEKEDKALAFKKGDWEGYFGGSMRIEYYLYEDMTWLNKDIPDELGVFKQSIDFMFDLIYGKRKYGHDAFELYVDLRNKNKFGVSSGTYKNTTATEIKFVDSSLGEHSHRSSRPTPWFKEAWIKFSFNSIFNSKIKELQYFQIGWFPFLLGRGIALGASYGTAYEELGLFSYYDDTSAPGIDVYGEIVKDTLYYDLYFAKFEDNTTQVSDEFYNDLKKNHIGRKYNPWTGAGKDDELWAARLYWTAFDNKKFGRLDLEPYFFLNEASDQKVEFKKDTKTQFGSYGLGAEYSYKNFEMGAEVAFNYGTQKLYAIDRNLVKVKRGTDGTLYEQYNNVSTTPSVDYSDFNPAPVTTVHKKIVEGSNNYTNGAFLGVNPNDPDDKLWSGNYRFRPEYKNHLKGWMGVVDMAYTIENWNLKLATEFLYASGDYDPNEPGNSEIEKNKTYHGFLGLHEIYNGYRVKSALLSGERETAIPTSLRPGLYEYNDEYYANSNVSMSDLIYIGFAATWSPKALKSRNCKINPNVICFWKAHESYKYVLDKEDPNLSHTSETEKARRYLGTEANIIANIDLLKDLTLIGVVSFFFTGPFFTDIKGVPLSGDYYRNVLGAPDSNRLPGANPAKYRLSDDNAFYLDISLNYKF